MFETIKIIVQIFPEDPFSHLLYSKKKQHPLQYTYDYILEKIVRRFNCTLLYRLCDVIVKDCKAKYNVIKNKSLGVRNLNDLNRIV
jgi:hypothetical protein